MKLKKLLSLVVVMMLVITTLPVVVHAAGMTYMDWNYTTKQVEEKTSEADPVKITSTTTELQAGWYYVTGTVSISSRVDFSGDVHIIFKEGSKLVLKGGIIGDIQSGCDNNLYLYEQNPQNGGTLKCTGINGETGTRPTSGSDGMSVDNLVNNGVSLTSTGGNGGASESTSRTGAKGGGGIEATCIVLNSGKIEATGGSGGDGDTNGSDGGNGGYGIYIHDNITVNAGEVIANGSNYGRGRKSAQNGEYGAAIKCPISPISDEVITVNGGSLTAEAYDDEVGSVFDGTISFSQIKGSYSLPSGIGYNLTRIKILPETPSAITVKKGAVYDLNGEEKAASTVLVNDGGKIKDSSGGNGILKVAKESLYGKDYTDQIPLYDADNKGYRFLDFESDVGYIEGNDGKIGTYLRFPNAKFGNILKKDFINDESAMKVELNYTQNDEFGIKHIHTLKATKSAILDFLNENSDMIIFDISKFASVVSDNTEIFVTYEFKDRTISLPLEAGHYITAWNSVCNSLGNVSEISTEEQLRNLFTNGGSGYLANDITIESSDSLKVSKNVDICLNGNVLNLNNKCRISVSSNSVFNLYDCHSREHRFSETDGVWVLNDALSGDDVKHTINGGIITGGVSTNAGAVYINLGSTFNMYGGNLVGNIANEKGGAVYISSSTFNMCGGGLIGNMTPERGGAIYNSSGNITLNGGVIANNNATLYAGAMYSKNGNCTINGGTVENNISGGSGGAFYQSSSPIALHGGVIQNNTAGTDKYGGGMYLDDTTLTMDGGTIANNSSSSSGGGLYLGGTSALLMSGGCIIGNKTSKNYGGGVYATGADVSVEITGGTITENMANNGGGVGINSGSTLFLGKTAIIEKNTKRSGEENNLFNRNSSGTMNISSTSKPADGMRIGLDTGVTVGGATEEDVKYFYSTDNTQIPTYAEGNISLDTHTHQADMSKKTEAKEATCTENGNVEWYACTDSNCGLKLDKDGNVLENVVIPLLGHIDSDSNGFCDRCQKSISDELQVTSDTITMQSGNWYLSGKVSLLKPLTVEGNVALYLADEAELNANCGIVVPEGSSLTINAQSNGENMGKVVAKGVTGAAGIGGSFGQNAGEIIINSGDIFAQGGLGAAGIGGGFGGNGGNVVINGGIVTAKGGLGYNSAAEAAGIGGGYAGACGTITINKPTPDKTLKVSASGGKALGAGLGAAFPETNIVIAEGLFATAGGKMLSIDDVDGKQEIVITSYSDSTFLETEGMETVFEGSQTLNDEEKQSIFDEIMNNSDVVLQNNVAEVEGVEKLVTKLKNIEATKDEDGNIIVSKITYDVTPKNENGEEVHEPSGPITFSLPVPRTWESWEYDASQVEFRHYFLSPDGVEFIDKGVIPISDGYMVQCKFWCFSTIELTPHKHTYTDGVCECGEYDPINNKLHLIPDDEGGFKVLATGEDAGKGVVIIALYDNENLNKLLDVKTFDLANDELPTDKYAQSGYVKAMWWTGLDTMTPFCSAVGKEITE